MCAPFDFDDDAYIRAHCADTPDNELQKKIKIKKRKKKKEEKKRKKEGEKGGEEKNAIPKKCRLYRKWILKRVFVKKGT